MSGFTLILALALTAEAAPPAPQQGTVSALSVEPGVNRLRTRMPRTRRSKGPRPPRTPKGLSPCMQPMTPQADLPRDAGETVRYLVDVDGLSVGTVDFKIETDGTFEGARATEYRSLFKLDALVATFVPIEGRAASVVPSGGFWPLKAMNRYKLKDHDFEEDVDYEVGGRGLTSKRSKNGKSLDAKRTFVEPALDFVSGFYMLRRFPREMDGCTLLYGNQRAYTVWIEPAGAEKVKTPVGMRDADRYTVRYASERSRKPYEAQVWLGQGEDRLPYRAEIVGKYKLEARIHLYELGE